MLLAATKMVYTKEGIWKDYLRVELDDWRVAREICFLCNVGVVRWRRVCVRETGVTGGETEEKSRS